MKHYDIGILGVWFGCNYGSIATYYALNLAIKNTGRSVVMIDKPKLADNDPELGMTHSRRFALEHYDISPCFSLADYYHFNEVCSGFVVGSDQVWNYGISTHTGYLYYLDFADDDKLKISYAASLGHSVDFAPVHERGIISNYLSRFSAISVREKSGVDLLQSCYGIQATQVLDPVFLTDISVWNSLADKSDKKQSEKFLVTYILDPDEEKRNAILHVAKKLGDIKVINVLDGIPWLFDKNRELMNLPNCVENAQVEDWLYFLKNAEFVITDSCHGLSFSLIFKKRFIALTNVSRGYARFESLSRLLGFEERLVSSPSRVLTDESLLTAVNYEEIDRILSVEKVKSLNWLKEALENRDKKGRGVISLMRNVVPKYDSRYWYQEQADDGQNIRYIPVSEQSERGKFIFFKIKNNLLKGEKYRIRMLFMVSSDAPQINIHVDNSERHGVQIIYRLVNYAPGELIEVNSDFEVALDNADSISFGASQITGAARFLQIDSVEIFPV